MSAGAVPWLVRPRLAAAARPRFAAGAGGEPPAARAARPPPLGEAGIAGRNGLEEATIGDGPQAASGPREHAAAGPCGERQDTMQRSNPGARARAHVRARPRGEEWPGGVCAARAGARE